MFNNDWDNILFEEINKGYFKNIIKKIKTEYLSKTIYPKYEDVFNFLKLTSYKNLKVVIIGQDPYHGENEAHGLAFSVKNDIKMPPSLNNIFKELYNDLKIYRINTDLTDWAKQGVLLINSILTVEKDKPLSHNDIGWQIFTDSIIENINKKNTPVVFVLWGNYAKSKEKLITNKKHLIIKTTHPSPLSAHRGFFNSKPFSKINKFLKDNNLTEINW